MAIAKIRRTHRTATAVTHQRRHIPGGLDRLTDAVVTRRDVIIAAEHRQCRLRLCATTGGNRQRPGGLTTNVTTAGRRADVERPVGQGRSANLDFLNRDRTRSAHRQVRAGRRLVIPQVGPQFVRRNRVGIHAGRRAGHIQADDTAARRREPAWDLRTGTKAYHVSTGGRTHNAAHTSGGLIGRIGYHHTGRQRIDQIGRQRRRSRVVVGQRQRQAADAVGRDGVRREALDHDRLVRQARVGERNARVRTRRQCDAGLRIGFLHNPAGLLKLGHLIHTGVAGIDINRRQVGEEIATTAHCNRQRVDYTADIAAERIVHAQREGPVRCTRQIAIDDFGHLQAAGLPRVVKHTADRAVFLKLHIADQRIAKVRRTDRTTITLQCTYVPTRLYRFADGVATWRDVVIAAEHRQRRLRLRTAAGGNAQRPVRLAIDVTAAGRGADVERPVGRSRSADFDLLHRNRARCTYQQIICSRRCIHANVGLKIAGCNGIGIHAGRRAGHIHRYRTGSGCTGRNLRTGSERDRSTADWCRDNAGRTVRGRIGRIGNDDARRQIIDQSGR